MLILRTFGGLSLTRGDDASIECVVPRRTLALLAVLAASPRTAWSRERLAAMLWPESDEEAARNSLRQALFRIKQDTGATNAVTGSADLRLNESVVDADVTRFLLAFADRDWQQAVAHYGGEFVRGFALRNGGEFERWTTEQRHALASHHRTALQHLADAARRDHRQADEITWRARLRDTDPLDTRHTREYMRAAATAGDVTEALRAYSAHERALRAELDLPPHNELVELARLLRQQLPVSPPPSPALTTEAPLGVSTAGSPPSNGPVVVPAARESTGARSWRARALTLAGLGVAALAVAVIWRATNQPHADEASPRRIMVRVGGGTDSSRALGRSLAMLVAIRLNGVDDLDFVIDDDTLTPALKLREVRDGPSRTLQFELLPQGAQVQLLVDLASGQSRGRRYQFELTGASGLLPELADQSAFRLLPKLVAADLKPSVTRAAASTQSLEALKAFVAGERDLRSHRYAPSLTAMQQAVTLDSSFAFAWHRLAEAADWSGHTDLVADASRRGAALAGRLSEHDAALVRATHEWRIGNVDAAEAALRRIINEYPQDLEAWYFLGEVQFHSAPLRGRSIERAREALQRAASDDSRRRDALKHLMRLAAWTGDLETLDVLERETAEPGDTVLNPILRAPFGLMARHDTTMEREFEAALRQSNSAPRIWEAIDRGAVYTGNVRVASRVARILTEAPWHPSTIRTARLYLASHEAARGRFHAADSLLAAADAQSPTTFLMLRGVLASVPWSSLDSQTVRAIHERLSVWTETPPGSKDSEDYSALTPRFRALVLPMIAPPSHHESGERAAAESIARDADEGSLRRAYLAAHEAAAMMAHGDKRAALRLLENSVPALRLEVASSILGAHAPIRWLRAELLREMGRPQEALDWYRTMVMTTALETPYLAPAHLRSAQILDSLQDHALAALHYRAFIRTWQEADQSLQPLVAAARARLGELDRPR